jgi:DNA (cytosine-5)-methyltransferase 1
MTRPLLLDLFCCQGGAAAGYHRAGFDVIGVDIEPQPHYPFRLVQADAITLLAELLEDRAPALYLEDEIFPIAAIHASPPCQDHSAAAMIGGGHGTGWMLGTTLELLRGARIPWVVENVDGAALARQDDLFGANGLELCGCMFPGLRGLLYENRLFETSFPVPQLSHVKHLWPQTKMGRSPKPGECMQVTGHFTDAGEGRRRMAADWMTRDGLAQAVPPAYTEYLGGFLMGRVAADQARTAQGAA